MDATVTEVPERSRYEVVVDGAVAGYAEYQRRGSQVVFPHTVVEPEFEGRGLAGRLVRTALDDASARGHSVIPHCSYVRRWIELHPDYQHLVVH